MAKVPDLRGAAPAPPPPPTRGAGEVGQPAPVELTHAELVRLEALQQARTYCEKRGMRSDEMLQIAKKFEKFILGEDD